MWGPRSSWQVVCVSTWPRLGGAEPLWLLLPRASFVRTACSSSPGLRPEAAQSARLAPPPRVLVFHPVPCVLTLNQDGTVWVTAVKAVRALAPGQVSGDSGWRVEWGCGPAAVCGPS